MIGVTFGGGSVRLRRRRYDEPSVTQTTSHPVVSVPGGDASPRPSPAPNPASGSPSSQTHSAPGVAGVEGAAASAPARPARKKTFVEKVEAYISRLASKNNFWHGVTSLIWLPFAARSGIKMYRSKEDNSFTAVLPFKRFNRNWYNAMAGASLLGNAEIAGGMYVFGACGGDYTVVCKNLDYKFLRPCFGPAVYKITPREKIEELVAAGSEFNFTVDMDVVQQINKLGEKEKRVGRVVVTFHVTPKAHHKSKKERRARGGGE